jgi:hypothetical protein
VADFREHHFNSYIARYFPFPHRVAKGIIIDSNGNQSRSIDCVIINPCHPYLIDTANKIGPILADGVDAAIEIKSNLANKSELERGLQQMATVKQLRRRHPTVTLIGKYPEHIRQYSMEIPAFLFALGGATDPIQVAKNMLAFDHANQVTHADLPEFVIISGKGIIRNVRFPDLCPYNSEPGLYYEEWKERTLAAFILYLNDIYPAQIPISDPMLPYYLKGLWPDNTERIEL